MNHREAKRMLEALDDAPMSEEEARQVYAVAESVGLAAPAWVKGPGPMPTSYCDEDSGPPSLLMVEFL